MPKRWGPLLVDVLGSLFRSPSVAGTSSPATLSTAGRLTAVSSEELPVDQQLTGNGETL